MNEEFMSALSLLMTLGGSLFIFWLFFLDGIDRIFPSSRSTECDHDWSDWSTPYRANGVKRQKRVCSYCNLIEEHRVELN